jgi:phosphatidylglycerol:prolipoprotein diacylglycerol transferase
LGIWAAAITIAAIVLHCGIVEAGTFGSIGIGAAAGGATGNLFDQLRRGAIVDFIAIGWWPAFNVADAANNFRASVWLFYRCTELAMRKILFSWNGLPVYSYPAMLYVGMVAGVFAGAHVAQLSGMNPNRFAAAVVLLIIPALIGSRLFFVFSHWNIYRQDLPRIWRRSEGGMAMYGGLIVTLPLSIPLLRAMQLPFGQFWDVATFTILLGMMFTRIGCLLNGCCSGRPTSAWCGLNLPDHRGIWRRRIPTQILEMTWAAAIFGAAIVMQSGKLPAGTTFCFAVVGYGTGRFFLEPLRDREMRGDVTILRTASLLLVATALTALVLIWCR